MLVMVVVVVVVVVMYLADKCKVCSQVLGSLLDYLKEEEDRKDVLSRQTSLDKAYLV